MCLMKISKSWVVHHPEKPQNISNYFLGGEKNHALKFCKIILTENRCRVKNISPLLENSSQSNDESSPKKVVNIEEGVQEEQAEQYEGKAGAKHFLQQATKVDPMLCTARPRSWPSPAPVRQRAGLCFVLDPLPRPTRIKNLCLLLIEVP